jgi:hypothetical protein
MNINKAFSFISKQYDPQIQLCRESPKVHPNYFWVKIDNQLAFWACLVHGERELRNKILKGLEKYPNERHGRIEAIIDGFADSPFLKGEYYDIDKSFGEKVVRTEKCTGEEIKSWRDYADLLCYSILTRFNKGGILNRINREIEWLQLRAMWDNDGFNDVIAKESSWYATYKLALYEITRKTIGKDPDKITDRIKELLGLLQSEDGGMFTDYIWNKGGTWVGEHDQNTETTAFCLLSQI